MLMHINASDVFFDGLKKLKDIHMTDKQSPKNAQVYDKFIENNQTNPVTLYLEGLAPTGRRSMRSLLELSARILNYAEELENDLEINRCKKS